jgi:hypothetical protein
MRVPYEIARLSRATEKTYDGIANSGITIVAGCVLVFATDWCVQFAFRKRVTARDDETEEDTQATQVDG